MPLTRAPFVPDAGLPRGFALKMLVDQSQEADKEAATIMQQQFAAIGVTLSLQTLESVTLQKAIEDPPHNYQMTPGYATSNIVDPIGKKGDSLGDQLAFGNPLYDAANQARVGRDQGNCVRTVVGKAWECFWTVLLPGGQITVEGPFYDNGSDSMLAITGGIGVYRGARGQMRLHARNAHGTAFDFIYELN